MIGGFHVSGSIAMSETGMPPELQAPSDDGITLVKGEVERRLGDLVCATRCTARLRTLYDDVSTLARPCRSPASRWCARG